MQFLDVSLLLWCCFVFSEEKVHKIFFFFFLQNRFCETATFLSVFFNNPSEVLCRMPSVCLCVLITYCVSVTAFQSCVTLRAPTYWLKIVFSSRVVVEWEIWSESEGWGMRGRASGRMSESQSRWTKGPVLSAPADRPPECHSWFTFPRGAMATGCTPL